jgi:ATP-binding cassette subfamily F protein 3
LDIAEADSEGTAGGAGKPLTSRKEEKRQEAWARQNISGHRNDLKKAIRELEQKIELLEKEKKEIENLLADTQFYKQQEQSSAKIKYYQEIMVNLPDAYRQWEKLNLELEQLLQSVADKNKSDKRKE